jgi:hypothetical protein
VKKQTENEKFIHAFFVIESREAEAEVNRRKSVGPTQGEKPKR